MAFDYAGAKAAGYTDEEIQSYLSSKQETPAQQSTLGKVAELTGIPKYGKSLAAAGYAGAAGVANLMGSPKALPLAEKAMKLREETGTTGSVQQGLGPTLKTLGNVGEATLRTQATVKTLAGIPSFARGSKEVIKKMSDPTEIKKAVTKVNSKLNPFSRIAESGTKAAKGQGFDWKQFEKKIVEGLNDPGNASDRTALLKYHNKNFKGNFGNMFPVEGVRKGADAAQALASRRGLDARWGPSSFLGKLISALKDSSDPIKSRYNKLAYQAFNDQLKKIPGVSNADAKIWLLNQIRDLGVTGYVAKKGSDVFSSLTGGSSK